MILNFFLIFFFQNIFKIKGNNNLNLQCSNYTCCFLSNSELCSLNEIIDYNKPILIFPGENTRCIKSTSTPYAFQVYRGSTSKLLFYFQGGGSCWDYESTLASGYNYKNTRCRTDALPWTPYGVFDRNDPRNPYKEYTIVNVLYCSGDNHIGNVIRNYTDENGIPIQQVGTNNVISVINWIKKQQQLQYINIKLDDLVIMGCSAGSIASQIWSNEIIKQLNYPNHVSVVLDSYIGLFPEEIESTLILEFGICKLYFLTDEIRQLCENQQISMFDFIYSQIKTYPYVPYLYIHSQTDRVQIKYYNYIATSYNLSLITTNQFIDQSNIILKNYNKLNNFIIYYIDSTQHCYTPTPYMYYTDTTGIIISTNSDSNDDEISNGNGNGDVNNDNLSFDMKKETLNKWMSRIPLQINEKISSQCNDNICNSYYNNSNLIPKEFTQLLQYKSEISDDSSTSYNNYKPSNLVQFFHSLPHWNQELQKVSIYDQSTQTYSIENWKDYIQLLIPFSALFHAIFLFLGLLAIFVVLMSEVQTNGRNKRGIYMTPNDDLDDMSISFSDVYPTHNRINNNQQNYNDDSNESHHSDNNQAWTNLPSHNTLNNHSNIQTTTTATTNNNNINKKSNKIQTKITSDGSTLYPPEYYHSFLFFLGLSFLSNLFLFIGYSSLHNGTSTGIDTLNYVHNSFIDLSDQTNILLQSEQNITNYLDLSYNKGCHQAEELKVLLNDYDETIIDYQDTIQSSLKHITTITNITNNYLIQSLNIFIFLLFSLILFIIILYIISTGSYHINCSSTSSSTKPLNLSKGSYHHSNLLLFTIIFTVAVYILSMIFGTIYLIFLIAISDYCMNPTQYISSFIKQDTIQQTFEYYISCIGVSPLASDIFNAEYITQQFDFYVTYLSENSCQNSIFYLEIQSNILLIYESLSNLMNLLSCSIYSSHWLNFLHDGMCDNIFLGLFLIWIIFHFTNIFLLMSSMYSCYLYSYLVGTRDHIIELSSIHSHQSNSNHSSYVEYDPNEKRKEYGEGSEVGNHNKHNLTLQTISPLKRYHKQNNQYDNDIELI